jgi:TolB-like protein/DNA-binding winged helix-turn-helix (wHTH) protein
MQRPPAKRLRIGAWRVDPASCEISREGETARVEVRTMRLLVCLAERAGEVVSSDELLNHAWAGVIVSQDSVYQAVASLRRLLGDDPRQPTYIETVPRLGYRMVAPVSPWTDPSTTETASAPASGNRYLGATLAIGAALCLVVGTALLSYSKVSSFTHSVLPAIASPTEKSIAVLPFLDLTETMNQEPFADGMTEELIQRLSKVPGLRVHAPTPSLKAKRSSIVSMARMLDVTYVLEGSVRTSGAGLRVGARLIRGNDEYVVWSETYDRPANDILMVQDDIAGEVTKALRAHL